MSCKGDLNLEATELRLGLPGSDKPHKQTPQSVKSRKRSSLEMSCEESRPSTVPGNVNNGNDDDEDSVPPAKAQIVGWPPVRSYRKNAILQQAKKNESGNGMYVKVSMDGAPYLRKIDVKVYKCYPELLKALEILFKSTIGEYSEREGYDGSEYMLTYEDKDGDWMLVGDVPWDMFISSCKRLRIMKASEAKGSGCL